MVLEDLEGRSGVRARLRPVVVLCEGLVGPLDLGAKRNLPLEARQSLDPDLERLLVPQLEAWVKVSRR